MKLPHFKHHFDGLKDTFKVMTQEIESLRKERDEYRTKVESQVKELWDVRHSNICDRCRKEFASSHQVAALSRSEIIKTVTSTSSKPVLKSLEKLGNSNNSRIPILSQGTTRRPIQHKTSVRTFESVYTATPPSQSICTTKSGVGTSTAYLQSVFLSPSSRGPSAIPGSVRGQNDWSIAFNNKAKMFNLDMAQELAHDRFISHLKFSQDGKYLAAACYNGRAYIYDVQTGTLYRALRDPSVDDRKITAVSFSHDGKFLATASYESYIFVWEIKSRCVRNAFKGKAPFVHSLDFSPNGRSLTSVATDNTVRLWKMRDGSAKVLIDNDPKFLHESNRSFTSAVFSPNGKYIAASHEDGVVRIWDERLGQIIWKVKAHKDLVLCVAFTPDGRGLVSGGMDTMLKHWDISSLDTTRLYARRLQVTKNGQHRGMEEQTQPEQQFWGHEDSIYSLSISPNGRWLCSGSFDRSICIWDTRTATTQYMLESSWNAGNAAPCTLDGCGGSLSVDISPAGHYLASSNRDGLVTIWRYTEV